ncbi:MAG: histone H1 [Gammaproteobacteria bacterium]
MSRHYEALKTKIHEIEEDIQKFYESGNNAAGTRVRKAMQEVKSLAQEVRKEVTDLKNK